MFKNYLTIALRDLRKHPGYTFITVSGLALGMACCVLILLLVRHEWNYDSFHTNADDIYRTYATYTGPEGDTNIQAMMTPDFTPALAEAFPSIERATRYVTGSQDIQVGDQIFRHELAEVDSTFFELFSFGMLAGDPGTALDDPSSMVVTAETAERLFGVRAPNYSEALGRVVSITRSEERYDFTISGVAANVPNNSSIIFDALISFENYGNIRLGGNNWGGRTSTYIQLAEGQTAEAFEAAAIPFIQESFAQYMDALRSNGFLAEAAEAFQFKLQPLAELHLTPDVWVPYEVQPHNPRFSYIIGAIGLLVLLIACINFMILSVGRSASRAREVGMRKVLGANRSQLMRQFWGEALVLSGTALVLGLAIAFLALPSFNMLTGQDLTLATFSMGELGLAVLFLMIVVGLVAGGYPAFVLSRFRPAAVLKGSVKTRGNNLFTRSLVVVQYTISVGLIVCTLIMADQLSYLLNQDLGFEDEFVVVVNANQISREQAPTVLETFRNELLPYDEVVSIARTGSAFTRGSDRNTWTDGDGITRQAYNIGVDYDYIDLMGMDIVAGRNFTRDLPADERLGVLVNEALVREFGIEDPVGHELTNWLSFIYEESPTIVGVVKDFNFRSLHEEVQPVVMNMHPEYYNYMSAILVKLRPENASETLRRIEGTWSSVLPAKPFTYSFLDDDLGQQYEAEQRWQNIVTTSALLAILIACLGLFGLATLSVTKRTKEIGVRKVLGASISSVVALVSVEFVKLVAIATVLAWPLAYFGMTRWLDDFAYRIDLGPTAFALGGLAALLIAVGTVSYHAIRAARANPVESLRYE